MLPLSDRDAPFAPQGCSLGLAGMLPLLRRDAPSVRQGRSLDSAGMLTSVCANAPFACALLVPQRLKLVILILMPRKFFLIFLIAFLSTIFVVAGGKVLAQNFSVSSIAEYHKIDETVENGDLISLHANKNLKSERRYDPNFVGVVSDEAGIVLGEGFKDQEGYYPIISSGSVGIKVSTLNGKIKNGDRLTTSEIPGIAIRLDEREEPNPIAIALEDYDESNPQKIKIIKALLMKRNAYNDATNPYRENILTSLLDRFSLSKQRYESPSQLLRVFFAAVIVLGTFIFAFLTFKRVASNGITSLGRNPLAGWMIFLHLALNIIFILAIVLIGIVLAYFVVSL